MGRVRQQAEVDAVVLQPWRTCYPARTHDLCSIAKGQNDTVLMPYITSSIEPALVIVVAFGRNSMVHRGASYEPCATGARIYAEKKSLAN